MAENDILQVQLEKNVFRLKECGTAEFKQKQPVYHYQVNHEAIFQLNKSGTKKKSNFNLHLSPVSKLAKRQPGGSPPLGAGFTFAFGAFLTPPLEPAPDQAVQGARVLRAIGPKGHGLQQHQC